jgi:hypothetical protein
MRPGPGEGCDPEPNLLTWEGLSILCEGEADYKKKRKNKKIYKFFVYKFVDKIGRPGGTGSHLPTDLMLLNSYTPGKE